MFTLLFVVEVYFTFVFLDCVRYHKGFVKSRFVILIVACRTRFALTAKCRVRLAWLTKVPISVLYCYCNFGRAEENRSLYQDLRYIDRFKSRLSLILR